MTSEQRHKNIIASGQQVNRHTSRPNVFYYLPTRSFLKPIFSNRTNGTFGFARHTSRPFAKPKEPFFANALNDVTENINLKLAR